MSYLLKSVRFSVLAVMFVKSVLGPQPTTRKRNNTVHEQTYKTIVADTRDENNNIQYNISNSNTTTNDNNDNK